MFRQYNYYKMDGFLIDDFLRFAYFWFTVIQSVLIKFVLNCNYPIIIFQLQEINTGPFKALITHTNNIW